MEIPVFVSTAWLGDQLGDAAVAVVDVRPPFFCAQAHLPGAVSLPHLLRSIRTTSRRIVSRAIGAVGHLGGNARRGLRRRRQPDGGTTVLGPASHRA
jgi:hypothetical protein